MDRGNEQKMQKSQKIITTYGKEFYITGNQKIIIELQSIIFHLL